MRFGLKAAILQAGLSQRQTGKLADIPENRLSTIVRGWANPTAEERSRLAAVLGKSETALFDPSLSIEIRSVRG
jgi:transcriptional regulator with XRE-family HTH domain